MGSLSQYYTKHRQEPALLPVIQVWDELKQIHLARALEQIAILEVEVAKLRLQLKTL